MLVGPLYFPHLREAEDRALAAALERRRKALERMPAAAPGWTRLRLAVVRAWTERGRPPVSPSETCDCSAA